MEKIIKKLNEAYMEAETMWMDATTSEEKAQYSELCDNILQALENARELN